MRTASLVILLYGVIVLGGGIIGYIAAGSMASLVAGGAFGLGLLASGIGVRRGKKLGFVFAPLVTLLLTVVFAYRFVQSGDFIPSGLMGILSVVALALYFALRR